MTRRCTHNVWPKIACLAKSKIALHVAWLKQSQCVRLDVPCILREEKAGIAQSPRHDFHDESFVSQAFLAHKKREFTVKLALTVIVGICTTLLAVFVIMRRSASLSEQLASLEAKVGAKP